MPRPQHVSIADMSPGDIELAAKYFQMASPARPLSLQEFVDWLNRDTNLNISKPTASRALAKIQKRSDVKIFDETEGGAFASPKSEASTILSRGSAWRPGSSRQVTRN